MKTILTLLIIASQCILTGCGFYLRDSNNLPEAIHSLKVVCDENSRVICKRLESKLPAHSLAKDSKDSYQLNIKNLVQSSSAISIDSKARAAEYEIKQSVTIVLKHPTGSPLLDSQLNSSQHYRYQEENIIAKERESKEITSTLHKQLVELILQRLKPFNQERIDLSLKNLSASRK